MINIDSLQEIKRRFEEVTTLMSQPEVATDVKQMAALGKEHGELKEVVTAIEEYEDALTERDSLKEMVEIEEDEELLEMAKEELEALESKIPVIEDALQLKLIPKDPEDSKNAIVEIRAGTGGDEAALFAGDLFRLYNRFAEKNGWKIELMETSHGTQGGFKEVIFELKGSDVFGLMKYESGVHRVQRVPATESQGRIHTSACTVAVLPEPDEIEAVEINNADLRVDTYRASGAGGQHVNKTDSAVRLTHLPTGIVVECQDERSQHKNRARAMSLLQARLLDVQQQEQQSEQAAKRKLLVGSGDRSERIRTYNYPQGRVTDHRINLTLYKLDEILEGSLDPVIEPLQSEYQADKLAELDD